MKIPQEDDFNLPVFSPLPSPEDTSVQLVQKFEESSNQIDNVQAKHILTKLLSQLRITTILEL